MIYGLISIELFEDLRKSRKTFKLQVFLQNFKPHMGSAEFSAEPSVPHAAGVWHRERANRPLLHLYPFS